MEQFCPLYINVEAKAGVLIIGLNVNAKPFWVCLVARGSTDFPISTEIFEREHVC
jgi:hypothetical protein